MARPLTDPLDRTIWNARLDSRLRKYRAAGLTRREIGLLLGVSAQGVGARLKHLRIVRPVGKPWADVETFALIRRLEAGDTGAEIAASLGRSLKSVRHRIDLLRDAGLIPPAPERRCHFPVASRIQPWQ